MSFVTLPGAVLLGTTIGIERWVRGLPHIVVEAHEVETGGRGLGIYGVSLAVRPGADEPYCGVVSLFLARNGITGGYGITGTYVIYPDAEAEPADFYLSEGKILTDTGEAVDATRRAILAMTNLREMMQRPAVQHIFSCKHCGVGDAYTQSGCGNCGWLDHDQQFAGLAIEDRPVWALRAGDRERIVANDTEQG